MRKIAAFLVFILVLGMDTFSQEYRPLTQGFGTYLQTHLSTDSMLEALSDMGFNRMMLEPHNMHTKANEEGIAVELANWWAINTDTAQIENIFKTATQVEDLIGINMADEPYLNGTWYPYMGQHSYPASHYAGLLPDFRVQYPDIKLGFTFYSSILNREVLEKGSLSGPGGRG